MSSIIALQTIGHFVRATQLHRMGNYSLLYAAPVMIGTDELSNSRFFSEFSALVREGMHH